MTKTKKYIFGYGSLMSPQEICYTLGRQVDVVYPVYLQGWIRDWSVVCANNSARQFTSVASGLKPGYIAALNIRLPMNGERATSPNGVIFEVTDSDIAKMDIREKHYQRVDIGSYITNPPDGIIYAYTGLDEHLYSNKPADRQVVLPSNYMNVVVNSAMVMGTDFFAAYQNSTLSPQCEISECILEENVVAASTPIENTLTTLKPARF